MYKIAVIEEVHKDGIDVLAKNPKFDYELITDSSEENLIKILPNFDGCTLRVSKLNESILKHCKKLKVISRHGVGIDNVDLNYIKKNNIKLLITATANAVAVAEHVMTMILTISKEVRLYDNEVRIGNFKSNSKKIKTIELLNKNILIAGFGRIGKNLIKKCLAFNMNVIVYDPYVDVKVIENFGGTKIDDFEKGLEEADFLSIHMPLTNETKNLITLKEMKLMKKNSIIINAARGGIVNENDLNYALDNNIIAFAGIDVFEIEPPDSSNPLLKNKKVLLSPHAATFTKECLEDMSLETAQNLIDFFENKIEKNKIVSL